MNSAPVIEADPRHAVGVLSVTTVLKEAGLVDDTFFTELSRWRGSVVHKICEYEDLNDLDESSVDDAVRGYLEAYRTFKQDYRFEPALIEHDVYSTTFRYKGRLDRFGALNGKKAILDIKTGTVHKTCALQLAGYAFALAGRLDVPSCRMALRIDSHGTYQLKEYRLEDYRDDIQAFLGAVNIANWKRRNDVR